jgi:hypothetical protein
MKKKTGKVGKNPPFGKGEGRDDCFVGVVR